MPLADSSIPVLLRARVDQQPDATAFTFMDYDQDPNGFAESLTWSQVSRRARVIAEELALCGSPGDRAAILAPCPIAALAAICTRPPRLCRCKTLAKDWGTYTIV